MSDKNAAARGPVTAANKTLGEALSDRGVSRRTFLKFASYTASIMALPPTAATAIAQGLANARRQSVIWLSFQECTGCTESITRAGTPSIEDLIFDFISLDYHHTLQNASGHLAELAREQAMEENKGEYLVIVDGSVPLKDDGVYSTIAGMTNLQMLQDTVRNAKAVISVGSCAAFGGIPGANPNPTGAVPISDLVTGKPLITKLSPNQTDIAENARRCIEAGSDAFAVINTLMGMAIDIESRTPHIGNNQGGLSGPAIKPIALLKVHQVYQVARDHGIPIIGQGGVTTPNDAIEFLLAGATAVGVGTALFYDPLVLPKINRGIGEYLERHGLSRVSELTGAMRLNTQRPAQQCGC